MNAKTSTEPISSMPTSSTSKSISSSHPQPIAGAGKSKSSWTSLENSEWVVGIAKYGLIGMLLGAAYGAARHEGARRGVLFELSPEPEAFDLDTVLPTLYHKLSKYRHFQEAAYVASLRAADSILLREREISRTRVASDGEYTLAQTFYIAAMAHLMQLRNRAPDGKSMAEINELKNEIGNTLRKHLTLIHHMCCGLRV